MQFTVERDVFLAELSRVTGVIENRNTIPICGHVRIEASKTGLNLRTTNCDMEAETFCAANVTTGGLTTVNGRLLADFVKSCPDKASISAIWDAKKRSVLLVCGRSRGNFATLPEADFPSMGEFEANVEFAIEADALRRLIERTRIAVSTNETQHWLHGIYLHIHDGCLGAAATDGVHLSAAYLPLPGGCAGMEGSILSPRFLSETLRVLSKNGEVSLTLSDRRVALAFGDFRMVSKLIEGSFPDYRRLIDMSMSHQHCVRFDREDLLRAVERVRLIMDETAQKLQVTIRPTEIHLAARNKNGEAIFDAIDAECEAPETVIGVNGRLLANLLNASDAESMHLHFASPADVMKITDADEASEDCMLIMPMQNVAINEEREAA